MEHRDRQSPVDDEGDDLDGKMVEEEPAVLVDPDVAADLREWLMDLSNSTTLSKQDRDKAEYYRQLLDPST